MVRSHEPDVCQCSVCGGTKSVQESIEKEQKAFEEYGWIVHLVPSGDEQTPYGYNAHTHGFEQTFNCLDFQIVFPIPSELAHDILISVVNLLKDKELSDIKDGDYIHKIIQGYPVKVVKAKESDRDVWRIIFPDKHGKFDTDFSKGQMPITSDNWLDIN